MAVRDYANLPELLKLKNKDFDDDEVRTKSEAIELIKAEKQMVTAKLKVLQDFSLHKMHAHADRLSKYGQLFELLMKDVNEYNQKQQQVLDTEA